MNVDPGRNPVPSERPAPIQAGALSPAVWRHRTTVRFGQCDPAGIVYTPVWFDIFNVAVEEWYDRALGLDYYATIRDARIGLGYGHASVDFFVPGFMGDVLDVAVVVSAIGRASFALTLHVLKGEAEAARGRLLVVTTSLVGHRPVPIPDALRIALDAYRARCEAA